MGNIDEWALGYSIAFFVKFKKNNYKSLHLKKDSNIASV